MKRVLINLVHPNIGESRVNKLLTQTAQKEENVTIGYKAEIKETTDL